MTPWEAWEDWEADDIGLAVSGLWAWAHFRATRGIVWVLEGVKGRRGG
jgi:hypothetical protein